MFSKSWNFGNRTAALYRWLLVFIMKTHCGRYPVLTVEQFQRSHYLWQMIDDMKLRSLLGRMSAAPEFCALALGDMF